MVVEQDSKRRKRDDGSQWRKEGHLDYDGCGGDSSFVASRGAAEAGEPLQMMI
jgi:hypothetical protein